MWTWLIASALAGYGDARDGLPSIEERELQVWTNAARMDPSAFQDVLRCWGDFSSSEKRSITPLAYSRPLNEAARFHADDMLGADPGGRSGAALSHSSTDGTPMERRVSRYYEGFYIGENVAWNYPDPYGVVVGWLCSPGHRANMLEPGYSEFGGGVALNYWVQNFGDSGRPIRVLNMGAHSPAQPGSEVELLVDVYADQVPDGVYAVVDGVRAPMDLSVGRGSAGVYSTTLATDGTCHLYWFEADVAGGVERFPEHGAYGWGDCDFTEPEAQWMRKLTTEALLFPEGPIEEGGCSTSPAGRWAPWAWLAALGLMRRRRQ